MKPATSQAHQKLERRILFKLKLPSPFDDDLEARPGEASISPAFPS
jgi:hypothetical protein